MAEGTLLIKVRFHGDNFEVASVKHLSQTLPEFIHPLGSDDIVYQMSDELDQLLLSGTVSNPAIVHGVLSDISDQPDETHATKKLQEGVFMLRLPYENGMRFLKLMQPSSHRNARSLGAETKVQRFDLLPFMQEVPKP